MPNVTSAHLRNVTLLGHSSSGKTSVGEAMVYVAGTINRLGRVEDGTTISDYDPEEVKRRTSTQTSLLPYMWHDVRVNVLDTPGYADFYGEAVSELRVADAAILVVAAPSGVEVGTEQMWRRIHEINLPCIIFVNQMDRERADFHATLKQIQELFGKQCVPLSVPVGAKHAYKGVVDLLSDDAVPADVKDFALASNEGLLEAIAEKIIVEAKKGDSAKS